MELRAGKAKICNRPLHLFDGRLAFVGIDAGEADELLWISRYDCGDVVVAQRGEPRGCLGVPGQEDTDHVELCVVCGEFFDILEFDLGAEIARGGLSIGSQGDLEKLGGRQVDMKVDGAWHILFLRQSIWFSTTVNRERFSLL